MFLQQKELIKNKITIKVYTLIISNIKNLIKIYLEIITSNFKVKSLCKSFLYIVLAIKVNRKEYKNN